MTRAFLTLAVALSLLSGPPLLAAQEKGKLKPLPQASVSGSVVDGADIPWKDPGHEAFFKYQAYLAKLVKDKGLPANVFSYDTEATWKSLTRAERIRRVAEGEAYLQKTLEELLATGSVTQAQTDMMQNVWGPEVMQKIGVMMTAKGFNNPAQIKAAQEEMAKLKGKLGGVDLDWAGVFDGTKGRGSSWVDPYKELAKQDTTKVSPASPFFDSLSSPETAWVLESKESFSRFLSDNKVNIGVVPGLLSMYEVINGSPPAEKAELSHILPTAVRFIKDGKTISIINERGALGLAVPGKYDKPEMVGLGQALVETDPKDGAYKHKALVAGKTLAHEFQHIYDMYTGRYYTLDSELRGFKTAVLYFRGLEKAKPAMYADLLNSDNDEARHIAKDGKAYSQSYDEGPKVFAASVSQGHGYGHWYEGVFQGRVPLRKVVDPNMGAPVDLEGFRAMRAKAKAAVETLEKRQAEISKARETDNSRQLDKEFEKVTTDLEFGRQTFAYLDEKATTMEMRLRRMQTEAQWLDKKSKAKGEKEPPLYDLSLAVDREYMVP
ncbi:MAG: hypothetical protein HZB91_07070 [Elusimicrobia bacterium]|nr:hypothetical protein [Elusimicrobiota bacterium]